MALGNGNGITAEALVRSALLTVVARVAISFLALVVPGGGYWVLSNVWAVASQLQDLTRDVGDLKQRGATVIGLADAVSDLQSSIKIINDRGENTKWIIEGIKQSVDKINDLIALRTPERFTKSDAAREFQQRDGRLDGHEQRIQRLEARPVR